MILWPIRIIVGELLPRWLDEFSLMWVRARGLEHHLTENR